MKIKARKDNVVMEPVTVEKIGLIILAKGYDQKSFGRVVAIGSECSEDLKIDQVVVYDNRVASDYDLGEETPYIVVRERAIMAVVERLEELEDEI